MRASIWTLALLVIALLAGTVTAEEYRVIVNAKNPATSIDKRFLADAFLKKRTRWSNDVVIKPVDQTAKSAARQRFTGSILDRTIAAVRRYWAQVVFSGRGVAPPEVASDADVVKYVANNPGAIGYVSAGADVRGVKVLEVK